MLDTEYSVVRNWGGGFQAGITLANDGNTAEDGWQVTFTADFEITQIWGARIVSREGNSYTIEPLSWNAKIDPDEGVEVGFLGKPGGDNVAIRDVKLNGAPVDPSEPAPTIPKVSVADATVVEDVGVVSVDITLDGASDETVTVEYQTAPGTADGSDFTPTTGTVAFAPGETSKTVEIPITADTADEPDETFEVEITSSTGADIGDGRGQVSIVDDDLPPPSVVPEVSIGSIEVPEGDPVPTSGAGWFSTSGSKIVDEAGKEVKLAGVNWFGAETGRGAPDGLFARNYQDMMDQMSELGFNTIRLPFSNDALRDGAMPNDIDYGLNPDLQGLSSLEVMDAIIDYAGEIGMRVILDNHRNAAGDGASGNGLWYGEGYTQAEWVADWEMLAARYADNPTVAGFDLSNEPHSADWGSGNRATDWRLGAEEAIDAIHEINPNVLVLVEGVGGGYWWGGNLSGVADAPIRLEQTDKLVYSPHAYPNSIYSQPWFDDPNFPDNLTEVWDQYWGFIARDGVAPVLVGEFGSRLEDPKDVAWMEEFVPYLDDLGANWTFWSWNPNSGDTGGILADDWTTPIQAKLDLLEPVLGGDLDSGGGVDNTNEVEITVTLSEAADAPVTVDFATEDGTAEAGTDYVAATGSVTFAPGETVKTITVDLLSDDVADEDRSFSVRLTDAQGGDIVDAVARVTIEDDDDGAPPPAPEPSLSVADLTVDEGAGTAQVVVSLDGPATETVSANVSATGLSADGSDFSLETSSISIAPGQTSATIDLSIVDDAVFEGSQDLLLALTDIAGAGAGDTSATVTILDNDPAPVPEPGDGLFADLDVTSNWNSGFVAQANVFNDSGTDVDGWSLTVTTDAEIVNIWNAEILSHIGNTYVIGNLGYNAEIEDGSSKSWGFQAAGSVDDLLLGEVTL